MPIKKGLNNNMKFLFNHSGASGDILYSLYFCKELSEAYGFKTFDFNIQTNVIDPNAGFHKHPNRKCTNDCYSGRNVKRVINNTTIY